jgi:hypothetical protein
MVVVPSVPPGCNTYFICSACPSYDGTCGAISRGSPPRRTLSKQGANCPSPVQIRTLPKRLTELVAGAFVDLGVDLFATQHGVKALDAGDADAVELCGLQVLDVVKLGELAAVVGRDELLKFLQGLVAKVAAVDEKEEAARAGRSSRAQHFAWVASGDDVLGNVVGDD